MTSGIIGGPFQHMVDDLNDEAGGGGQSMNLWQVFTIQQTSIEPIDSTTIDQSLENGQVVLRSFCNDPVVNGVHIISVAPMKSLR